MTLKSERVLAILVALWMAAAVALFSAPPANASACTKVGSTTFCGTIYLAGYSQCAINIYEWWPLSSNPPRAIQRQGESSTKYFRDTDGYAADTRCEWYIRKVDGTYIKASAGPVKINDLNAITLVGFRK